MLVGAVLNLDLTGLIASAARRVKPLPRAAMSYWDPTALRFASGPGQLKVDVS